MKKGKIDIEDNVGSTTLSTLQQLVVSCSDYDFEEHLYKIINAYSDKGLSKSDLVSKMKYVLQSCELS